MEDLYLKSCELLNRLGATARYTGSAQMAYALKLCAEQQDKLLSVTKLLYPEVARHFCTNWKAVERNLRTAGAIIWRENRALLEELAGRPLRQKPPAAQLLAILTVSLDRRSCGQQKSACPDCPEQWRSGQAAAG